MGVKQNIASMFGSILDQLRVYDSNDTILVDGFDKNDEYCLKINSYFQTLYCVELSGTGNIPTRLSTDYIHNLFSDHRNDDKGYLIWVLLKKDQYQKNLIFTYSKSLAERFSTSIGGRKLHAFEIINAVYDIFMDNEYSVEKKNLKSMLDMASQVKYENPFSTFNSVIKEAVYGNMNNIDLYQAYEFSGNEGAADLYEFYKMNFTGALFTYINFSKNAVLPSLSRRIWQSTFVGAQKQFKELRDSYENGEVKLALINSVLMLRKGYSDTVPTDIGNKMKTKFIHKNLHKKDIIRYTPLIKRDVKFDRLVDWKFFQNYFTMVHKANTDVPDFYGKDLMGGFVNYGLKHPTKYVTNTRPHTLIFGPTGSGKTTTVGKVMASMLNVDYNTWEAKTLYAKNFRPFDIKRSMRPLTDKLATNPKNDIKFLSADLNYFSYNLVNIAEFKRDGRNSIDLTELAFASDLLSVIIETASKGRGGGLSAEEDGLFKELVRSLYERKNYVGVAIGELRDSDPQAYHRMISLGYKEYQNTTETKEAEFDYLRKPVLQDLINELKHYMHDRGLSEVKRKASQNLEGKLEAVNALGYFSNYDRIDLKSGAYLYFDMDAIKDIPEYVPIFLAIFNRVYTADKKRQDELKIAGKPRPEINYIFEEAKNLFVVPAFESILAKLANEARSYDIVLIFVLQRLEDVPSYIFSQIESKMILFPADNEKNAIIDEIVRLAKPGEQIVDLFKKTPQYGMTIWYEHGGFVMKFDLDDVERKIFESEGEKFSVVEARGRRDAH